MSTINQIASSTYRDTHKGLSNLQLQTREANKKAAADLQNQFLVNTPLFLHFLLQKYNGAVSFCEERIMFNRLLWTPFNCGSFVLDFLGQIIP